MSGHQLGVTMVFAIILVVRGIDAGTFSRIYSATVGRIF